MTACTAVLAAAGYRTADEPTISDLEILAAHTTSATVTSTAAATSYVADASGSATTDVKVASGKMVASLPRSALIAEVPKPVVAQLAGAVDPRLALRDRVPAGARFRLAYTSRPAGERSDYQLLALELEGRHQWHDSYYFDDHRGESGFFDRRGHQIDHPAPRYPVRSARITSRFSEHRAHPLLNVTRPHYGVDFAAPEGTPVRAVARGKVITSGWQPSGGRFVKLRHGDGLASGYAHLARIAPGLTRGTRVRRGQIIGYVGSTGLATGAHLHFAVVRDGRYVDPLSVSFARPRALRGPRLAEFRTAVARLEEIMEMPFAAKPIRTAFVTN